MIDPEDIDLIQVIDEPEQVVEAIFHHYEKRGFEPVPRNAKASSTCSANRRPHKRICYTRRDVRETENAPRHRCFDLRRRAPARGAGRPAADARAGARAAPPQAGLETDPNALGPVLTPPGVDGAKST